MSTFEQLIKGIRADFVFRSRPTALPPDLRPDWRIAVIVLILSKTGRGGTTSLKKLHVISWVIRNEIIRRTFLSVLNGNAPANDLMIRFDPAGNRAVEFAIGEKIVAFERLAAGGLNVALTDQGWRAAEQLEEYKDCLVDEKSFLKEVGKISEAKVDSILTWEE